MTRMRSGWSSQNSSSSYLRSSTYPSSTYRSPTGSMYLRRFRTPTCTGSSSRSTRHTRSRRHNPSHRSSCRPRATGHCSTFRFLTDSTHHRRSRTPTNIGWTSKSVKHKRSYLGSQSRRSSSLHSSMNRNNISPCLIDNTNCRITNTRIYR